MGLPEYKSHVRIRTPEWVLDQYYHTGEPYAFHGRPSTVEARLMRKVAKRLSSKFGVPVHTLELIVCGSAHLGFCPIPHRQRWGRAFDPQRSDIDIAVVSPQLFNKCWLELQSDPPTDTSQIAGELYWGFFNPANIRPAYWRDHKNNKFADTWWDVFGSIDTDAAQGVRGRLYRGLWEMQNYHRRGIVRARDMLNDGRLT